ncbi:MAG TPA: flagellar assembly protein A, partial [Paenibacillus sp.]
MVEHAALDKYLNVTISDDKTTAYLQFSSPEEFKFTPEELEKFIRNHKIQYGIEYQMIDRIADHPGEYYYSKTPIAIGVPPVPGIDGSIEFAFKIGADKTLRPLENEKGNVDYKEIISLNNVRKGQLIAQRKPAEPGKNGMSVQNEEI